MKSKKRSHVGLLVLLAAFSLLACDLSSVIGAGTPVVIVVTATPVPPTQTPYVVVVTATPAPATATSISPAATATSARATATFAAPAATATPQPTATSQAVVPTFGPITFAPGVSDSASDTKPIDAATRYPEGVTKVYAVFSNTGALKGTQWRYERYIDGKLSTDLSGSGWDLTTPGTTWLNIWNADGITPGEYELRLYIMDKLVQKSSFTINKRQTGTSFFGPVRLAEGVKDDKPVNIHKPTENFKAGIKEVYAFFDAGNMTTGLKWKREWYRDGKLMEDIVTSDAWKGNQTEKDWWLRLFNDNGLTSGSYELKLYIDEKLVQLGTFVIEK